MIKNSLALHRERGYSRKEEIKEENMVA